MMVKLISVTDGRFPRGGAPSHHFATLQCRLDLHASSRRSRHPPLQLTRKSLQKLNKCDSAVKLISTPGVCFSRGSCAKQPLRFVSAPSQCACFVSQGSPSPTPITKKISAETKCDNTVKLVSAAGCVFREGVAPVAALRSNQQEFTAKFGVI